MTLGYGAQGLSSRSHTSVRVGKAGRAWTSRRSRNLADDRDRGGVEHLGHIRTGERGADDDLPPFVDDDPGAGRRALADEAGAGGGAELGVDAPGPGGPRSSACSSVWPTAAIWGSVNTTRGADAGRPSHGARPGGS